MEPGVPAGGLRGRGRAAAEPDRRRREDASGPTACCYAAHKGVFDLAATEDREVPVVVTDFATAELVKVAANAFLATKISFINAMAEVCEAAGGDVTQLARAIGYDPRIGNRFLQAGVGFGGGCLPKDIRAFQARAQELGAGEALRFLHEVDLINHAPPGPGGAARRASCSAARRARPGRTWPGPGSRCSARRSSPTPTTSATRRPWRSPRALAKAGARRARLRPAGHGERAARRCPRLTYEKSMTDAVTGADLVCVLTEWAEFRNADPHALGELVAGQAGDRRPELPGPGAVGAAGWTYRGMGRPAPGGLARFEAVSGRLNRSRPASACSNEVSYRHAHMRDMPCGRGGAVAQAEQPDSYDDELARIDASIADLKIRDMAAAKERTQIASKIQAAQFQRDILAHANQQKAKKAKARRVRRPPSSADPQSPAAPPPPSPPPPRAAEGPPDWAAPGTPYTGPPGAATDGRDGARGRPAADRTPGRAAAAPPGGRPSAGASPARGLHTVGPEHPARPGRAAARCRRGGVRRRGGHQSRSAGRRSSRSPPPSH